LPPPHHELSHPLDGRFVGLGVLHAQPEELHELVGRLVGVLVG
jgi:hypothetical protein